MGKIFARLVVILAVCLAITGGVYWLVVSQGTALGLSDAGGHMEGRGLRPGGDGERAGFEPGQALGARPERGEHEGGDAGRGLVGILRSLGVVAAVTAGVLLIQTAWARVRGWRMKRIEAQG